jgi:hypothetical protein
MNGYRGALCAVVAAWVMVPGAPARADVAPPEVGVPCSPELADAMTLMPDQTTYVACQQAGPGYAWTAAQAPFPPNDKWLSYGPPITLHGQGMRNPNLSSGQWTATPQDPEAVCRVTETTVVEAGVLAPPQVSEGEQGKPLSVEMWPKLFYAELAGNCLWVKDQLGRSVAD